MLKALWILGSLAAAWAPLPAVMAQEGTPEIIASHIRTQGYPCDDAKSAQHELGQSMPNEQVWILQCSNAAYRVRLVPNLAAQVERLN